LFWPVSKGHWRKSHLMTVGRRQSTKGRPNVHTCKGCKQKWGPQPKQTRERRRHLQLTVRPMSHLKKQNLTRPQQKVDELFPTIHVVMVVSQQWYNIQLKKLVESWKKKLRGPSNPRTWKASRHHFVLFSSYLKLSQYHKLYSLPLSNIL
jgi:hypothetical protein